MSQWKVDGAGEYIPPHELSGTTLVTKHNNGPHTPTPTVSLYELSGQDHPFVPTTSSSATTSTSAITSSSSWSFDDQRRHKSYPTNPTTHPETATRSDGTMPYSLQVPGDKQLWSRHEKISITKRPIDYASPHTNKDINAHTISSSSLSPTSSLLHPLTNDYMNLQPDGSLSVRTTPSQVIPPVTLPTNHHQDHRIGNQGMVAPVDNKQQHQQHQHHQNSIKQQQQQQQQQQYQLHSGHSHYSEHKDTQRSTKYPYSRSFSDTPHSLLPYHHHPHSSQHRHNSIATAEHAAARAAAVAVAYQSQSMNPSQMTWYPTFHQKGSAAPSSSTSAAPHPPLYNHSTSSSPRLSSSTPKCQNESQVYQGSNYTPMSDLLASSRIDNVEYGISSSSSSASTPLSHPFLGQHRHSTQWTSSSSTTSSSPTPPSPRTNDMQSLLSMSFTPAESYNNKKNNDTMTMDQKPSPPSDSKKKQPKKPPTGKRRSPNAFFVFCSDRRQLLKQGRPNARNTDINRQLGDDWRALTQAERDWYKDKADKIRAALPNDNTPTPKSMTTNLFSSSHSPFTYSNSSFDSSFNQFTPTSSRNNSLALTIAADDDQYPPQTPKRSSLESDLYASSTSSSAQQQHPLAVVSLSGAAEANALDQAAFVGIPRKGRVVGKTARLKRPPNAYLLFNREMRSKLKEENDDLTVAAISKLISQSWRDLPQERKDDYRNEAENLKEQHLKNHPDYVYIRRSRTELAQAGYRSRPTKKRKKSLDDDTKTTDDTETPTAPTKPRRSPDPRGRKKKKHKNPFGPKHPMSGFLYFASDIRPEIVQQHPDSGVGVISKLMAERWKKLTDQEKHPWKEKAEKDKARYAREVLAFKLAQDQQQDDKQHTDEGWMEVVNPMKKSSISSLSSSSTTSTKEIEGYHPKPHCFYKPVSRIHSALTSSRPASPTELDSHTIQTVAQMVNPRNTPTGRPGLLHPLATPSSLASIIHHEAGNYQLHVPATPPSPAIDTI